MKKFYLTFVVTVLLFSGCDVSNTEADNKVDDVVYTNDDQSHFSQKGTGNAWDIDNENRTATVSADPDEREDWLFASLREDFDNFELKFEFMVSEGHKFITAFVHVKERHETPASKNLYRVSFSTRGLCIAYQDESHDVQYGTDWVSSDAIDWNYNQWHSIIIRSVDSVFTIHFDDEKVGDFEDINKNAVEGYLAFGGNNYFDSGDTGEPTTLKFRNWSVKQLE